MKWCYNFEGSLRESRRLDGSDGLSCWGDWWPYGLLSRLGNRDCSSSTTCSKFYSTTLHFCFYLFYFHSHSVSDSQSLLHMEEFLHRLPRHTAATCVSDDKEGGGWNLWAFKIRHEFCIQADCAAFCSSVAPRSRSILMIWKNIIFPSLTGSSVYTERKATLCRVKGIFLMHSARGYSEH